MPADQDEPKKVISKSESVAASGPEKPPLAASYDDTIIGTEDVPMPAGKDPEPAPAVLALKTSEPSAVDAAVPGQDAPQGPASGEAQAQPTFTLKGVVAWILESLGFKTLPSKIIASAATSLLMAGVFGYLGIIGIIPALQTYMEQMTLTERLIDQVQRLRVSPMLDGKFNILVADLDNDDANRTNTAHIAAALDEQFGTAKADSVLRVQRGHRILRAANAPDTATAWKNLVAKGHRQLAMFGADLLVWGEVAQGRDKTVLRLQFLAKANHEEGVRGRYALGETFELPENFGSDLGTALAAQVLTDISPSYQHGIFVADLLGKKIGRLRAFVRNLPRELPREQRAQMVKCFADGLLRIAYEKGAIDLFSESVSSYKTALSMTDKTQSPRLWASAQNNLAMSYRELSALTKSVDQLALSAKAFEDGLTVITQDSDPRQWARTQSSLGVALRMLGDNKSDDAILQRAEKAGRLAVEFVQRGQVNASSQQSAELRAVVMAEYASTLDSLASRSKNRERQIEAIDYFRQSVALLKRDAAPLQWGVVMTNMGLALRGLGRLDKDAARLEEAASAIRAAGTAIDPKRAPIKRAIIQLELGRTIREISRAKADKNLLADAVAAHRVGIAAITSRSAPRQWASLHDQMGTALFELAAFKKDRGLYEEARASFTESVNYWKKDKTSPEWLDAQDNLIRATSYLWEHADGARERRGLLTRVLDLSTEFAAMQERRDIRVNGAAGPATGRAFGHISWYALFAKDAARALSAAKKAVGLLPDELWLRTNEAHALLFLGRMDEAKAIYRAYRGRWLSNNTKTWEAVIREDFAKFRDYGLGFGAMAEIEKTLTSG